MRGAVLYAPGDVRVEEREDPRITEPTDAIIRLSATCVCGSDLWSYRGLDAVEGPSVMGHEYAGYQSACVNKEPIGAIGAQAERIVALSCHEPRQRLARGFGATDVVTECGDEPSCSSPACTCTAGRPRCAGSCPSSST